MSSRTVRKPTVLIPYPGPCPNKECHDVFVYLRPETNGVKVESTLLRVINSDSSYKERLHLAYLANIPGDFIVSQRIIEKHYAVQLFFASKGKSAFTGYMRRRFEDFFKIPFPKAEVIGSFEAMSKLQMDYNELFQLHVPQEDMLKLCGQTVKRYMGLYIVNYDIPALLHKNNNKTDIAVMIFRTPLGYRDIHTVIDKMGIALLEEGILNPGKPLSRIFHYSKGPFDQIRDAIGYLYNQQIRHVSLKQIAFADYLISRGFSMHQILGLIKHPLLVCRMEEEDIVDRDIFTLTTDESFAGAYERLGQVMAQYILPRM